MAVSKESELPLTESEPEPRSPAPPKARGLHPAVYIASWIFFSNLTILFNKWLLDTAGFTVVLTCWHLAFSTAATQILARTTRLLDGRHAIKMTPQIYARAFVPIGVLYSGSLVCSNLVYLHLNVAFIQMLKAAAPVAVLVASWLWRLKDPSWRSFGNIAVIMLGVMVASAGEIQFSWLGVAYQAGGIVFEAMRLVMIEVLLKGEGDLRKMDPLLSLYYYAPVCAVMNGVVVLFTEAKTFQWADVQSVGIGILLLNASVAFALNVASVSLIGKTSGLVLTLTGILKNLLLIFASILIWGTTITALQCLGYAVAIVGLLVYSETLRWEHVIISREWLKTQLNSPGLNENRIPPALRTALMAVFVVLIVAMLWFGFNLVGDEAAAMPPLVTIG